MSKPNQGLDHRLNDGIKPRGRRYSNAGHNPPLVLHPEQPPEWLLLPEGFFLGTMEESVYETRQLVLAPGDMLLLYTGGVTEAMNDDKGFYQEARLIRVAEDHRRQSPEGLVREILRSVRTFAGSEPQSDDITLLALSFQDHNAKPS
jgi:phosphoserine phosphatase RsbU/P